MYKLDVPDANVRVWKDLESGYWHYSFAYLDGSAHYGDSGWGSERWCKEQAKAVYYVRKHKFIKRAKWKRVDL
ncbi:MAG: hypothetical protein FVQ80_11280 [Planctomycetes bacterium]|nr:hypothetical protein [Planctomycetota bacterium]